MRFGNQRCGVKGILSTERLECQRGFGLCRLELQDADKSEFQSAILSRTWRSDSVLILHAQDYHGHVIFLGAAPGEERDFVQDAFDYLSRRAGGEAPPLQKPQG
jgi:hypothetical protein